MFCTWCQKYSRRLKKAKGGHATWVDIACIMFTRQSLTNHEASESHKEAVRLETQLCSPGIVQALSNVKSAGRRPEQVPLSVSGWLCKQEIAHTTNFSSLLQLGKSLGAVYLNDCEVGRNVHYTSERFIH